MAGLYSDMDRDIEEMEQGWNPENAILTPSLQHNRCFGEPSRMT